MFGLKFNPFRSMTLQGTVVAVGTYLWSHLDQSALSPQLATVLQAVGAVWGIIGLRNGVAKGQ